MDEYTYASETCKTASTLLFLITVVIDQLILVLYISLLGFSYLHPFFHKSFDSTGLNLGFLPIFELILAKGRLKED